MACEIASCNFSQCLIAAELFAPCGPLIQQCERVLFFSPGAKANKPFLGKMAKDMIRPLAIAPHAAFLKCLVHLAARQLFVALKRFYKQSFASFKYVFSQAQFLVTPRGFFDDPGCQ